MSIRTRMNTIPCRQPSLLRGFYEPIPAGGSCVYRDEQATSRMLQHTEATENVSVGQDAGTTPLNEATESRRERTDRQDIERAENEGMIVGQT
jgi:hypothetical protein